MKSSGTKSAKAKSASRSNAGKSYSGWRLAPGTSFIGEPVRTNEIDRERRRKNRRLVGSARPISADRKVCDHIHRLVHICRSRHRTDAPVVHKPLDSLVVPG